jgi:hypothetical protein
MYFAIFLNNTKFAYLYDFDTTLCRKTENKTWILKKGKKYDAKFNTIKYRDDGTGSVSFSRHQQVEEP